MNATPNVAILTRHTGRVGALSAHAVASREHETYAYRRCGSGPMRPLLLLQHFMGTLDNWDPAVSDPLASGREVILIAGHGSLFQFHESFTRQAADFLASDSASAPY